ncbi:MAG TPA: phosphatase PAP2-related protein, partial [Thermoanaerobaculia bacterium]
VARAILGPTIRPFLGLVLLFALRQLCQGLCALPAPDGMIWRSPGFPSLLVTYGTSNDLFFSGHTAIAVYGGLELAHAGGAAATILAIAIVLIEAVAVIVLRAHYTMDVFAGAVTALWVWTAANALAPGVDRWLAGLLG